MASTALRCPQCHDEDVRRSRSRWYDFPLRVFGVKAYRCLLCDKRFYGRRRQAAEADAPPSA